MNIRNKRSRGSCLNSIKTNSILIVVSALSLLGLFTPAHAGERAIVHHELRVVLDPQTSHIEVVDKITLPKQFEADQRLAFALHRGMVIEGEPERDLQPPDSQRFAVPVNHYQVMPQGREVILRYAGQIHHDIAQYGRDFTGTVESSAGMISAAGVFLAGSSAWYPITEATDVSFSLSVQLPDGWSSVSQGGRSEMDGLRRWQEQRPQQEIYLIAAPFSEYQQTDHGVEAMVFLRQDDAALAGRYLDLTSRYLQMYSSLIGAYRYAKFALVENFWETGFGMPSFTLLGPKVVRLPFIPYTSYPHEILHNWWGNGVYVDYDAGNWSEGLTSYLADHLLKEMRGGGSAYRRAALQGYANYVGEHKDFPLAEFRFRHGASSQAIGYGKGMMLFHMLRQRLGDDGFKQLLQRFYREHQFKAAGYDDWQRLAEQVAGKPLSTFFDQWLNRTGAPALSVADVVLESHDDEWVMKGVLHQAQSGPAYELEVPVYISLAGQALAQKFSLSTDSKQQAFEYRLAAKPLRLDIDPEYDLFRQVSAGEIPAALSLAFAANQVLVVLPSNASAAVRRNYQRIAQHWLQGYPGGGDIAFDEELEELPSDRAVWLLGKTNRFALQLPELADNLAVEGDAMQLNGQAFEASEHSLVLTAKHPDNSKQGLVWLISERPDALLGLLRKLPHYGKYSYLAFAGDAPDNQLKGQWQVKHSPLAVVFPGGEALQPNFGKTRSLVE